MNQIVIKKAPSQQLWLPGIGPPPMRKDRLFFVVFPELKLSRQILRLTRELKRIHNLRGRPLGIERFHVSLYPIGDFVQIPDMLIDKARHAAAGISANGFDVGFDRVMSLSGSALQKPLVLTGNDTALSGLEIFHQALCRQMSRAGLAQRISFRFTPHLTLLYDRRSIKEIPIPEIRWRVERIRLVRSILGETRYECLGEWDLL